MKPYLFILIALSCCGCMDAIMKDQIHAERNAINWSSLRVGMSKREVLMIMGMPEKKEKYVVEEERFEIWYYLTNSYKPLVAKNYPAKNYTPLIFEGRELKGWGYDNYYSILKISPDREKKKEEGLNLPEQYVEKKEDWPKEEHTLVPPPDVPPAGSQEENEEKIKGVEKELEETLKVPNSSEPSQPTPPSPKTTPAPQNTLPDLEEENYIWE